MPDLPQIDASIIGKLAPPTANPLETVTKAQGLAQSLLQNRLLNQQYQSKVAGGRALTGAIDPATGLPDQAKVGQFFVDHPELQQFSADALTSAQTLRSGQLANVGQEARNTESQAGAAKAQLMLGAQAMDSLLSRKGPLTTQDLIQMVRTEMLPSGLYNVPHLTEFVANAPQPTGDAKADDAAVRAYLTEKSIAANNALDHITTLKGPVSTVDTGPAVVQQQISPLTGAVNTVGAVEKGLSPGESVAPDYTITDANGVQRMVTKGEQFKAQKGTAPPAGIQVTPPAGAVSAAEGQAKDSQTQFAADTNDAGGFSQRMLGLTNAEKALKAAQTGKGGQTLQDWRALLTTLGVPLSEADKSKALNFDEAKKYLTDYANRRGAALGIGTDAGREMVHAANPSVDINKAAAQDIIKVIRGMERMQNAQVAAATAAGITPDRYSPWRASWNRSIDPRGFMADEIPAAKRAREYDAMSKTDQAKYAKAVKAAVDAGYFTLDDLRK